MSADYREEKVMGIPVSRIMSKHRYDYKEEKMKYQEGTIRPAKLSCLVMQNGEIICAGKSLGWVTDPAPSYQDEDRELGHYIEFEEEEL